MGEKVLAGGQWRCCDVQYEENGFTFIQGSLHVQSRYIGFVLNWKLKDCGACSLHRGAVWYNKWPRKYEPSPHNSPEFGLAKAVGYRNIHRVYIQQIEMWASTSDIAITVPRTNPPSKF